MAVISLHNNRSKRNKEVEYESMMLYQKLTQIGREFNFERTGEPPTVCSRWVWSVACGIN